MGYEIVGNTLKFKITSTFGATEPFRKGIPHKGIDFSMVENTELRSIYDGVVQEVIELEDKMSLGNGVMIKFEDGTTGVYGHLKEILVKEGQTLKAGDLIGYSGNTGHSTGAHLHFGLKDPSGQYVDPSPIVERVADMQGENVTMGGKVVNKINEISDYLVGKEIEFVNNIFDSIGHTIGEHFIQYIERGVDFLTVNMPSIGAYLTIILGGCIMISGNITKWLSIYGMSMLGVVLWIINANS